MASQRFVVLALGGALASGFVASVPGMTVGLAGVDPIGVLLQANLELAETGAFHGEGPEARDLEAVLRDFLERFPQAESAPDALAQLQEVLMVPAVARVLDLFLAYDAAIHAALRGVNVATLAAQLDAGVGPSAALPDWRPVVDARNNLARAALALRDVTLTPPAAEPLPPLLIPPVLALDLAGADTTYTSDVAFLLDVGGNDVYLNNAGGSWLDTLGSRCDLVAAYGAAVLIDVAGNDAYPNGDSCGVNGGGYIGAGLLVDLQGDDVYGTFNPSDTGEFYGGRGMGYNGGGLLGVGGLVDAQGSDAYVAGTGATNGGAWFGVGFLWDADHLQNDRYVGLHLGTNGGAYFAGVGSLVDAGGDDAYEAGDGGTNGGGAGGAGALLDHHGWDSYKAGRNGVNGGGGTPVCDACASAGLLVDFDGRDVYEDQDGGSGVDRTVVPKGTLGAQVDLAFPL